MTIDISLLTKKLVQDAFDVVYAAMLDGRRRGIIYTITKPVGTMIVGVPGSFRFVMDTKPFRVKGAQYCATPFHHREALRVYEEMTHVDLSGPNPENGREGVVVLNGVILVFYGPNPILDTMVVKMMALVLGVACSGAYDSK